MNLFRDKQFGLKIESVSGVQETLSASDYGISLTDLSGVSAIEAIDANTFRGSISATASRIGTKTASFELGGELKNSGVLNTKPKIDPILTIARFVSDNVMSMTIDTIVGTTTKLQSVITGGTSSATGLVVAVEDTKIYYIVMSGVFVSGETITSGTFSAVTSTTPVQHGFIYRPSSTIASEKTATINLYDGGIEKNAYGAAGTFTLSLDTESYPSWTSSITAVLKPDEWGVEGTKVNNIVYEDHLPEIVNAANLAVGTLVTPVTSSIECDLGNTVVMLRDLNSPTWLKYALVTSREATATISCMAEPDSDVYAKLFAGQTAQLTFTMGSGDGNRIDIIAPAVQFTGITESDQDSLLAQEIACKLTGDDKELVLWFR